MDGYRISQAARETGLTATTLRFYEQQGIVVPDRAPNGYRTYDERALAALRFIARAKRLGLTLDEAAELVALIDDDRCEPVQARMKALVGDRIERAHEQTADLVAFGAELQRVAARLGRHTPEGPCDDACGCTSEASVEDLAIVAPVPLAGPGRAHIACSLEPAGVPGRISEWRSLLDGAESRDPLDDGMRIRFGPGANVAAIASLAAAEQSCCGFFTFVLRIEAAGVSLDITGPPEAADVIGAFAGG